ncbi:hypothetical protein [Ruminococcus sp.]|uniref:hypothetical protein n=1 Tax=Ruminococcus sp. TaxID=41978 RepID=UPI0025CC9CE4|nr:hypothetical protein [Ruminococcus sp.]MBQ8967059.1 hypothetical protein [Ruminococcus sp.]
MRGRGANAAKGFLKAVLTVAAALVFPVVATVVIILGKMAYNNHKAEHDYKTGVREDGRLVIALLREGSPDPSNEFVLIDDGILTKSEELSMYTGTSTEVFGRVYEAKAAGETDIFVRYGSGGVFDRYHAVVDDELNITYTCESLSSEDYITQKSQEVWAKSEHGAPTEVRISETGGEDGRKISWVLKNEGERFSLSKEDGRQHGKGEYEISREDYYFLLGEDLYAELQKPQKRLFAYDEVCFATQLFFEDGTTLSSENYVYQLHGKLNDIFTKYREKTT